MFKRTCHLVSGKATTNRREPTMSDTLTLTDALAIAEIIRTAQTTAKVARMTDDGDVVYGTARHIGDDRGAFWPSTADVRDAYLRVTTQAGWEVFWPVRELMPQVAETTFTAYDWA